MTNETVTKEPQNIFYTTVNDLEDAMKQKHLYADYALLDETWKKRFDDYMTGKKTMPLTYDPFFKCMFHPGRHPDWLSHLLSAIIGETVTVETVVLLSHKKPDGHINVKVEFGEGEGKVPLDNIAKRAESYKPKERVTYKMIKEYIEAKYGFKVHTACRFSGGHLCPAV